MGFGGRVLIYCVDGWSGRVLTVGGFVCGGGIVVLRGGLDDRLQLLGGVVLGKWSWRCCGYCMILCPRVII